MGAATERAILSGLAVALFAPAPLATGLLNGATWQSARWAGVPVSILVGVTLMASFLVLAWVFAERAPIVLEAAVKA